MKLDNKTLTILHRSPLFRAIAPSQFNDLIDKAKPHFLGDGEFLFQQGDLLEELYFCVEGCVKLFLLTPNGDEKIVDIIPAGNSFAEAVMFMGGQRYPVYAVALRPTFVVGINAAQYLDMLRASSELCINMMGLMSRRMHWLLNEVDRLTLHNATFRLASYLLEMRDCNSAGKHVCLNAPKHVVASRLSIKPETFSRILKRLSEQKLISVHDQHIELLDEAGLETIVRTEI